MEGGINSNNTYDNHCEQSYPWRRKTIDDEIFMTANSSEYSIDAEVDVSSPRRNVNMVEVNMGAGHATKSGRKIRNNGPSLIESQSHLGEVVASDSILDNKQNSEFEAVLSSEAASNKSTDGINHSGLERTSSLKTLTPKSRHSKVTTSSSRSNIPSRSDSPSPPSRNSANSSGLLHHSANAVNSFAHPTKPSANSMEPGSGNINILNIKS